MKHILSILFLSVIALCYSCKEAPLTKDTHVVSDNEITERKISEADLSLFDIRVTGAERDIKKKCSITFTDSTDFKGTLATMKYEGSDEMIVGLYSEEGTIDDFYKLYNMLHSEYGIPSYFYTGTYEKWIYDNVTTSMKLANLCLKEPAPLQDVHNPHCAIDIKDVEFMEDFLRDNTDEEKAYTLFYETFKKSVDDYAFMREHRELDSDNQFTRGEAGIAWEFKNQTIAVAISNNVVRMVYCDRGSDYRTAESDILSTSEQNE